MLGSEDEDFSRNCIMAQNATDGDDNIASNLNDQDMHFLSDSPFINASSDEAHIFPYVPDTFDPSSESQQNQVCEAISSSEGPQSVESLLVWLSDGVDSINCNLDHLDLSSDNFDWGVFFNRALQVKWPDPQDPTQQQDVSSSDSEGCDPATQTLASSLSTQQPLHPPLQATERSE